jgi:hypothetical protein
VTTTGVMVSGDHIGHKALLNSEERAKRGECPNVRTDGLRPVGKTDAWRIGTCSRCGEAIFNVVFISPDMPGQFCSRSCRDNTPAADPSLEQKRSLDRRTRQAQAARIFARSVMDQPRVRPVQEALK